MISIRQLIYEEADCRLFSEIKTDIERLEKLPTRTQLSGCFKRSQAVKTVEDISESSGCVENLASFETWVKSRIQLAERRGKQEDEEFYAYIEIRLVDRKKGFKPIASRLVKASDEPNEKDQRASAQLLLFRLMMEQIYHRACLLESKQGKNEPKKPREQNSHRRQSNSKRGGQ